MEDISIRELLWLRHGCPPSDLYGGQGEMLCCGCGVDFKKMSGKEIKTIWIKKAIKRLQQPQQPKNPIKRKISIFN